MPKVGFFATLLAAITLLASCSGSGGSDSTPVARGGASATVPQPSTATPRTSAAGRTFRSAAYGYTVTVPAGWTSRQAYAKWDGESELDGTSALVDLLGQPSETRGVFVAAARWKRDLAAYTTFLITWNAHYHGDYCPPRPNSRNPVTVGGQPGVLLAYNCGILVNNVVAVHDGVGYVFVFVDRGVAAATDRTDHATFLRILKSVRFPA